MPQEQQHRKPGSPADRLALGAGVGLLAPSTIGGHQVVQSARRHAGTKGHSFQSTDILRLTGKTKAKHAAGWAASRGLGGVGLGLTSAGLYGAAHRSSKRKVTDLTPKEGVKSLHQAAKNPKTGNRKRDIAVMGGSGLVGQAAASELVNSRVGRLKPTQMPHWGRAAGSATGAVVGLTAGRAAMHRLSRWDREQKVGKRKAETAGEERSRLHRNALQVQAAGQIPVIGDPISAGRAAQLAPREHRKRAFGTVLGSQWGANLGGTAVGGLAGYHLGRKVKPIREGSEKISSGIERSQNKVREKLHIPKREPYTGKGAELLRHVGKVPKALKLNTPTGMVGSMAGGALAVNTIPPYAYRRYQRKYEAKHPENVRKANNAPLTNAEVERIHRGKKRQARLSYTLAGMGAGASGLLLAGKGAKAAHIAQMKRAGTYVKPPALKPHKALTDAATNVSIASGGLGAVSSLNFARTQKLESRQKVAKAEWQDKRYRSLADSDYERATGMPRVHRGTYPPAAWMAENAVGVNRQGKVYVGRKQLRHPVNAKHAEKAGEHAGRSEDYRRQVRQREAVRIAASNAAGGAAATGMYRATHNKYSAIIAGIVGSGTAALGTGHLLPTDQLRRREGRSRRRGQDSLIRAAGFEKALLRMPRVPRPVPVGAGRAKAPVSSFVMRRRNPMTGATNAFTVRGGMR